MKSLIIYDCCYFNDTVIGYGTYLHSAATTDNLDDITNDDYLTMKAFIKDTVIDNGYIHIDTAEMYHTERLIGKALKDLKIDRSKLFITSKIMPKDDIRHHLPIRHLTPQHVIETVERSLEHLGTDYLDLYLIHSPRESVYFLFFFLFVAVLHTINSQTGQQILIPDVVGISLKFIEHC